jgi:hypothetical protein
MGGITLSNNNYYETLVNKFDNIDDLINQFSTLTNSYRLMIGAAEELTRTPSATQDIICEAIIRSAFLGNILDQFMIAIQLSIISNLLAGEEGGGLDNIPNPYM